MNYSQQHMYNSHTEWEGKKESTAPLPGTKSRYIQCRVPPVLTNLEAQLLQDRHQVDHGPVPGHQLLLHVDLSPPVVEGDHAGQEGQHWFTWAGVDQHAVKELVQDVLWSKQQESSYSSTGKDKGKYVVLQYPLWHPYLPLLPWLGCPRLLLALLFFQTL